MSCLHLLAFPLFLQPALDRHVFPQEGRYKLAQFFSLLLALVLLEAGRRFLPFSSISTLKA